MHRIHLRSPITFVTLLMACGGPVLPQSATDPGQQQTAQLSQALAAIPTLACPLPSCTVSGFGFADDWTFKKCAGKWKDHTGLDLHASAGNEVRASADGTVVKIYDAGSGWAQGMLISHINAYGDTYVTQLMHIDPVARVGDWVLKGRVVARVANLGSNSHLHFGVWNGIFDPADHTPLRGALPNVDPGRTCNDGTFTDPAFPALFEDPAAYLCPGPYISAPCP